MRVEYFEDTDTLQITFKNGVVTETIDLDEDTLLERDVEGAWLAVAFPRKGLDLVRIDGSKLVPARG